MLQIIDDDEEQEFERRPELKSIELLLDYFIHEISCRKDFEFIQAVVRLFLKVRIADFQFNHKNKVAPYAERKGDN